jgi:hypothetical protein
MPDGLASSFFSPQWSRPSGLDHNGPQWTRMEAQTEWLGPQWTTMDPNGNTDRVAWTTMDYNGTDQALEPTDIDLCESAEKSQCCVFCL